MTQTSVPSLVFPPWATRINANWNGLKLLLQSSHWLQRCFFVLLTLATSNATEIIHLKNEVKLHGFFSMCGHLPKLFSNQNRRGRVWKVQSTNCHSMPSCHLKRTRLLSARQCFGAASIYVCGIISYQYLIIALNQKAIKSLPVVYFVFSWRYVGHVGVPKQRNRSYVGVPN